MYPTPPRIKLRLLTFSAFLAFSILPVSAQQGSGDKSTNPLVQILETKGVLTADDVAQINQSNSRADADRKLAEILHSKGLISQQEYDQLAGTSASAPSATAPQAPGQNSAEHAGPQSPPNPTSPGVPSVVERVPSKTINAALSPIRPAPVGSLKLEEHPSFKADGVGITPYGFIKLTGIEDSSSPNGDDFPLPGFLTDTAPNGSPEFHLKSRSSRFGVDFQWYDHNPKWVITGKVEADFEGNFNRSDNRNLSTIRSVNPSLRLAWVRMDYNFNSKNSVTALFGQDWTTFGSSTLPNMLETTGLGVFFGTLYERDPQARIGFTHKMGGFSITPEVALDLPASGLPPSAANISNQLGYGERQGPDSNRPEVQARVVGQFQLDHAAGVPAAQVIFSGFKGSRTADVLGSAIPDAYKASFPGGVNASSTQDGWDAEFQLPTRYVTVIGKYYSGSDLRWFFAGQLFSFFNDTAGLTKTATVNSIDGASAVVLGTNASGQQVVAPERPIRADGGFVQVGLPLSKIFNADPAGRNAGWSLYGMYGEDQAKERDVNRINGNRHKSRMWVGTLNYKLNRWMSFSYEQSLYTTFANPEKPLPLFRGVPAREWNDVREEAGPVFTF